MDIHLRKLRVEEGAQYRRLRLVDVPTLFIESQEEFEQKSMEQISSEFLGDVPEAEPYTSNILEI